MTIGIPKEIMAAEARVAASPETVKKFIEDGQKVLIEKDAGVNSFYHDEDYVAMGAEIISSPLELYKKSDLILKVKEPLFNDAENMHEVDMMHKGQYLVTFIHPASPVNHDMVRKLATAGVISLTLDGVPRISRAQNMDALTSMSTCAGYKGILMAANDLSIFMPQMFTAVGMLKPAKVLVIGVGVAGLQALATAKRLGAITYALDIRPAAVEQSTSLGAKVVEFDIPEELAVADGGYANQLSEEWLEKERKVLSEV
ncbi:MAG: NAD(P)(+) transhydrogenase (Re/Si-specific) subunit alpha, partial [Bacteroidales bacterium]|nr:NAD(P)(+) transhydrogenase (Re/Si-specific) subunit alpha [Bacteroidales bacterium]